MKLSLYKQNCCPFDFVNYNKFQFRQSIKRMPKVGGRRKKVRSHKQPDAEQQRLTPKTFVFKKGRCPQQLKDLTLDMRKCFYPNTAMKLQDTNKMSIKSYLKAAKYYNVNHLVAIQNLNNREYIRFIKVGGGEMTFRIVNFSRMKDVLKNGGQPFSYSFKESLLVLNGFNESQQIKMIGKGLQELFPSLNLAKAKTQHLKRVVSFTYRPKKKFIFFRQYKIIQSEGGINSTFQKLMSKPQDLSNFRSLKEYLESQESKVQGTQNQQKLNLVEIGPRMKLKFISYKESAGVLSDKDMEDAENEYNEREANNNENNRKERRRDKKQEKDQQEEDVYEEGEQEREEKDGQSEDEQGLEEDMEGSQIDLQDGDAEVDN